MRVIFFGNFYILNNFVVMKNFCHYNDVYLDF
jgi:hypothetical protein